MRNSLQTFTSRDVIVTNWMDSLEDAYALMRSKGVRHLPVVDEHGLIVGIISDRDMQRAMQVEQSDFTSGYPARVSFDPQVVVRDFMSWPVETIDEKSSLADAAKLLLHKKISALLVTRGLEVAGIVTSDDLLRALVATADTRVARVRSGFEEIMFRPNAPAVGSLAQSVADAGI